MALLFGHRHNYFDLFPQQKIPILLNPPASLPRGLSALYVEIKQRNPAAAKAHIFHSKRDTNYINRRETTRGRGRGERERGVGPGE